MYFLLTGVALSPEPARQPPKFAGFPRPLRNLLCQMLHPNPDRRPKDLVVLGEMIRSCLLKIERRLALADRYGIPFRTTIPRPTQPRPRRLLRTALAFGALVLAAAVVVAVLFPESIGGILHRPRATKSIGILVGVPESSPTPAAVQNASTPVAPATVLSQAANAALALANQPATDGAAAPNSSQTPATDLQQGETSSEQPQVTAPPDAVAAASPGAVPETSAAERSCYDTTESVRACTAGHYGSVEFAHQKETRCFDIVASPGFDARSNARNYLRWKVDLSFAFGPYQDRRARLGRKPIRSAQPSPRCYPARSNICSSTTIWAGLFS